MSKNNNNKIILIKLIRSIILFISVFFIIKYNTIGKIPYNEIIMICSFTVFIQTMLDIYRPIIVIN